MLEDPKSCFGDEEEEHLETKEQSQPETKEQSQPSDAAEGKPQLLPTDRKRKEYDDEDRKRKEYDEEDREEMEFFQRYIDNMSPAKKKFLGFGSTYSTEEDEDENEDEITQAPEELWLVKDAKPQHLYPVQPCEICGRSSHIRPNCPYLRQINKGDQFQGNYAIACTWCDDEIQDCDDVCRCGDPKTNPDVKRHLVRLGL